MRIFVTDDPKKCGYEALKDKLTVSQEEAEAIRATLKKMKTLSSQKAIWKSQHELYLSMSRKYGGAVAGGVLGALWAKANEVKPKERAEENDDMF